MDVVVGVDVAVVEKIRHPQINLIVHDHVYADVHVHVHVRCNALKLFA